MANRPSRPLGNNTITRLRAPLVTDARDNTQYRDWDNATSVDIEKCMVEPYPLAEKLNVEDMRDREFVRSAYRVYAPKDTDVLYTDRFMFNGQLYEAFGGSNDWYHFDGTKNHVAFIIRLRHG